MTEVIITDNSKQLFIEAFVKAESISNSELKNENEIEWEISEKFKNRIDKLIKKERRIKFPIRKKAVKTVIIAAILLSLATTAYAVESNKDYIIQKFLNHSEYSVTQTDEVKTGESLYVNYIPKGFKKTENYQNIFYYENGDKNFSVEKSEINSTVLFDTEKYESENIKINNIDAVYYKSEDDTKGIIFNNGEFIFVISGNIEKEELIKIAPSVA